MRNGIVMGQDVKIPSSLVGSSTFNSTTGRIITHNLGNTNYTVIVTPTGDPSGYLGEFWVTKENNRIIVKCSGSDTTTGFDYAIIV